MPATIDLSDAGLATLAIPDADGEIHDYRFRLAPRGLAQWALEITRTDTDATYRVTEDAPGRWRCSCPAETFRKRGAEHCKHITCVRALRAFLRALLESTYEQRPGEARA